MSQTNQKLVNLLEKEFNSFEVSNSYEIKEFGLKTNFANSILVKSSPGGSRGGSCWGSYTSRYDNSDQEIINDLSNEITYKLTDIATALGVTKSDFEAACKAKAENVEGNYLSEESDSGGDYYGNYTTYRIYEVNVVDFFKLLAPADKFSVLQGFAANFKQTSDKNFLDNSKVEQIKLLNTQLEKFEETKTKEKADLEKNIKSIQKNLAHYTSKLANFDKDSSAEKKKIEKQLEALENPVAPAAKKMKNN